MKNYGMEVIVDVHETYIGPLANIKLRMSRGLLEHYQGFMWAYRNGRG